VPVKKVFVSYDVEHDEDLWTQLVAQSTKPDSPFRVEDRSLPQSLTDDGSKRVRPRIKAVDAMIVICGQHTDAAVGVSTEVAIAQVESLPYFLLWGRPETTVVRPSVARSGDKIYAWTWDTLKRLLDGAR